MLNDHEQTDDSPDAEGQGAHRALAAYRERRRRRRGDDTYFGSSSLLRPSPEQGLPVEELDSRRIVILQEAIDAGMPVELAGLTVDVAWEEGLDPAIAFELVRTGIGVAPPAEGISNAPDAPTADRYLPPWMFPPSPPDVLLRERMLRLSLRRLRTFLERYEDVDEAFRRFADEPDVGSFGY